MILSANTASSSEIAAWYPSAASMPAMPALVVRGAHGEDQGWGASIRTLRDALMPDSSPEERAACYDSMNDVLARLHKVDFRAVGLGDFGRPTGYIARQVARWSKQYEASKTEEIPEMDRLIEWLTLHIPFDDETTIAHGDYRMENIIFDASDSTSPDGISSYAWNFGDPVCADGCTASGKTVSHNYPPPAATYKVRLTITDNHGRTATVVKDVAVK